MTVKKVGEVLEVLRSAQGSVGASSGIDLWLRPYFPDGMTVDSDGRVLRVTDYSGNERHLTPPLADFKKAPIVAQGPSGNMIPTNDFRKSKVEAGESAWTPTNMGVVGENQIQANVSGATMRCRILMSIRTYRVTFTARVVSGATGSWAFQVAGALPNQTYVFNVTSTAQTFSFEFSNNTYTGGANYRQTGFLFTGTPPSVLEVTDLMFYDVAFPGTPVVTNVEFPKLSGFGDKRMFSTGKGYGTGNFPSGFLQSTLWGLRQPYTVYAALRVDLALGSGGYIIDGQNGINSGALLTRANVNGFAASATGTSTIALGNASFETADARIRLVTAIFDGANSSLQMDGGEIITGDVGSVNPNGVMVGCRADQTNSGYISLLELIIRPVSDSLSTRKQVQKYLQDVVGQSILP